MEIEEDAGYSILDTACPDDPLGRGYSKLDTRIEIGGD